jgi:hypothetical protein
MSPSFLCMWLGVIISLARRDGVRVHLAGNF